MEKQIENWLDYAEWRNASFIAAARSDIPALVAEVRHLTHPRRERKAE